MNDVAVKINTANASLLKTRIFVSMETLKNVGYMSLFNYHLIYFCIVSDQDINTVSKLIIRQKNGLRNMYFKHKLFHSNPLEIWQ